MQAQLHNATVYNADSEALKGQTLAVGSAKAAVIQFTAAGGYDGAVTVEISPDAGTTWFALQAESLAALGTYVSSISSFTPAYRVIVPSQVQLRVRMSGGTAGTLTVTAVPTAFVIPKVIISPPVNSVVPVLSTNTPVIGTAITVTPGTWTGSPTLTYQWQRNTGSWGNISGATSNSYTPVDADFGYTLRVVETGTNAAGSASTQSSGTSNLTREAVTQTWSAELLANGSLSAWTGGVPDGWSKANDNGTTATITETDRNGSAGTGAATLSNSGSAVFVNIRQTVYTVNDYYETSGEMTAYTGGRMDITFTGSSGFSLSAVRAAQFLGRAIGTELVLQPGGALPRLFTVDNWGVRRLTPNAELTAPSANMDIATFYTVPGTPLQNHAVWLLGRVSSFSSGNYFLWLLEYSGTQWNVNLYAVSGHTRGSALVSVSNVGTTNGMRFYANGNTIRVYTTANGGELWTQRGADVTNSTYNTAQGVNALLSSAFTLGQLTYVQSV